MKKKLNMRKLAKDIGRMLSKNKKTRLLHRLIILINKLMRQCTNTLTNAEYNSLLDELTSMYYTEMYVEALYMFSYERTSRHVFSLLCR